MKILIIETVINKAVIKTVQSIPRIGERVDLFYSPFPTIKDIVNLPTQSTIKSLGVTTGDKIDAVLFIN